jgi:hypothetical protein
MGNKPPISPNNKTQENQANSQLNSSNNRPPIPKFAKSVTFSDKSNKTPKNNEKPKMEKVDSLNFPEKSGNDHPTNMKVNVRSPVKEQEFTPYQNITRAHIEKTRPQPIQTPSLQAAQQNQVIKSPGLSPIVGPNEAQTQEDPLINQPQQVEGESNSPSYYNINGSSMSNDNQSQLHKPRVRKSKFALCKSYSSKRKTNFY